MASFLFAWICLGVGASASLVTPSFNAARHGATRKPGCSNTRIMCGGLQFLSEQNPLLTQVLAYRLYGLGACSQRGLLIAGDTRGCLHLGDARAGKAVGRHQVHKKGNKACHLTRARALHVREEKTMNSIMLRGHALHEGIKCCQ